MYFAANSDFKVVQALQITSMNVNINVVEIFNP